jgi:hypothetical protein
MLFKNTSIKRGIMKREQDQNKGVRGSEQSKENFDDLSRQADSQRKIKKPGSQNNHSKRHNNGRGGGK